MTNTYGSDRSSSNRSMNRDWQRPTRWSDMTNISMSGIADTMREKPEAFLLLAAGAALLMRGRGFGFTAEARPSSGTSSTDQGMPHGTGSERGMGAQQTGGGTGSMRDMQERAGSAATDTMNRARDAASDTMESVRSYSSDFADRVSSSTDDMRRMARERVGSGLDMLTDNPLLLALCGASAGILAASMLPRTDIEDQALRGVRRQVTDFAEQAQGNLADAFSDATDTLREETQRRGLTGESLKEVASKVAGAFTETVTGGSADTGAGSSHSASTSGATSGMGGSYGGPSSNTPVSTSATGSVGGGNTNTNPANKGGAQGKGTGQGKGASQSGGGSPTKTS